MRKKKMNFLRRNIVESVSTEVEDEEREEQTYVDGGFEFLKE